MIQELQHLQSLARRARPLPKGTKPTIEARFFALAREMVPAMVEELVELRTIHKGEIEKLRTARETADGGRRR